MAPSNELFYLIQIVVHGSLFSDPTRRTVSRIQWRIQDFKRGDVRWPLLFTQRGTNPIFLILYYVKKHFCPKGAMAYLAKGWIAGRVRTVRTRPAIADKESDSTRPTPNMYYVPWVQHSSCQQGTICNCCMISREQWNIFLLWSRDISQGWKTIPSSFISWPWFWRTNNCKYQMLVN